MLKKWLIGIVSVLITCGVTSGIGSFLNTPDSWVLRWTSIWKIILFVPVLGIVNIFIGNILKLLTLPISCLTLGLINFVISGIVFWIAGSITGAQMTYYSVMFGSVFLAIVSTLLNRAFKEKKN